MRCFELDAMFIDALRKTLCDESLDPAFRELVMTLPSEAMIAEEMDVADPHSIHQARQFVRASLAQAQSGVLVRLSK